MKNVWLNIIYYKREEKSITVYLYNDHFSSHSYSIFIDANCNCDFRFNPNHNEVRIVRLPQNTTSNKSLPSKIFSIVSDWKTNWGLFLVLTDQTVSLVHHKAVKHHHARLQIQLTVDHIIIMVVMGLPLSLNVLHHFYSMPLLVVVIKLRTSTVTWIFEWLIKRRNKRNP